MTASSSFERFQQRATDYAKYRPRYPRALFEHLAGAIDLHPAQEVADIGSGTGLFTELLLEQGCRVHAVEPSDDMRQTAERMLARFPGFVSVNGTAAITTLPPASLDVIFCAQAFHWFNHESTRDEWRRILRPKGYAVLVWNNIDWSGNFAQRYRELLLEMGRGAREVINASISAQTSNVLFPPGTAAHATFPNEQALDADGLIGRTLSFSFMPNTGDARFRELAERLRELFAEFQEEGRVRLDYTTAVVYGRLG
jgi:SAM-dependent methyltransferase